jgi:hypothetical protein
MDVSVMFQQEIDSRGTRSRVCRDESDITE